MSSPNSKLLASADPSPGIALTDDEAKLKLALIDAASAGGIAAVERGITAMHAEWYAPERQCKPMQSDICMYYTVPAIQKRFPMAKRPVSKNNSIPRRRKNGCGI